ncbi:MAG TPA: class I SAM-dependent methyltransferase [Gammaproteobacteria bacterium]|nr:class I SAM-dependent methyltransferase [Gammaproteobacteria bacterium]
MVTNKSVASYYNASAKDYNKQYKRDSLTDVNIHYPANYFRLQLLLNSFANKGVKRVIEIGVGEGTPLSTLEKSGIDIYGIDISHEMVKKSKDMMRNIGMDPNKIAWGDIQDPITYSHAFKEGQFDALVAMGVMPHVRNDSQVLTNMKALIKPGGSVFIEFRNKLFSLFTFNRYTYEFIMDDLLAGVSQTLKDQVSKDLRQRLVMEQPIPRMIHEDNDTEPGYDAILSRFHNPFEIEKTFKMLEFNDINFLWYHYHPAMPYLQKDNETLFRHESLKLEHDALGWRGIFLCSAFIIEAVKK